MAPSAIETVVVETQTKIQDLKLHSTPTSSATAVSYGRLFRAKFDKEAEEGKKGFPAAKVSVQRSAARSRAPLTMQFQVSAISSDLGP